MSSGSAAVTAARARSGLPTRALSAVNRLAPPSFAAIRRRSAVHQRHLRAQRLHTSSGTCAIARSCRMTGTASTATAKPRHSPGRNPAPERRCRPGSCNGRCSTDGPAATSIAPRRAARPPPAFAARRRRPVWAPAAGGAAAGRPPGPGFPRAMPNTGRWRRTASAGPSRAPAPPAGPARPPGAGWPIAAAAPRPGKADHHRARSAPAQAAQRVAARLQRAERCFHAAAAQAGHQPRRPACAPPPHSRSCVPPARRPGSNAAICCSHQARKSLNMRGV